MPSNAASIQHLLEPGEELHVEARAGDAVLAVTDRRLIVAAQERLALNVAIDSIRRIQFDVERRRPATLVIVPEEPADEPQVLAIPNDELEGAARAIAIVGRHFGESSDTL
jgi:hypothetical protein